MARRRPLSITRLTRCLERLLGLLVFSLVAAGVLTAMAEEPLPSSRPRLNPYNEKPEAIPEGRMLFGEAGCPKCHGTSATGGDGPNLTDDAWLIDGTDETLFRTISKGRPKRGARGVEMPSWEDTLEPDMIWKIIAWIRSTYRGESQQIVQQRGIGVDQVLTEEGYLRSWSRETVAHERR